MIIQIATVMIASFTLMYGVALLIKSAIIPLYGNYLGISALEPTKKEVAIQKKERLLTIVMTIASLVVLYYFGMLS